MGRPSKQATHFEREAAIGDLSPAGEGKESNALKTGLSAPLVKLPKHLPCPTTRSVAWISDSRDSNKEGRKICLEASLRRKSKTGGTKSLEQSERLELERSERNEVLKERDWLERYGGTVTIVVSLHLQTFVPNQWFSWPSCQIKTS